MISPFTRISVTAALAVAALAMVPRADADTVERLAPTAVPGSLADTTLADGAFTAAQVERGDEVFTASCVECHSTSEMKGDDFMFNWEGSSVGRLYRAITRTMPESDPGGLPTPDYLAVVAYILEMNGFPAGEMELTADTELLNSLRIEH